MEKLIELLNEYENTDNWENWHQVEFRESKIISKKFWFIKWLVENDKIDLDTVKEKIWIPCFVWYKEWEISCVNDKEDYEQLLMLLSIQDEPISFLISILK
jgi:hypothetical protein